MEVAFAGVLLLLYGTAEACDSGLSWGSELNKNATSFSATITWKSMQPVNGGSVFVSNFLSEGCGSGYVGAQWHAGTDQMYADWAIWDLGVYTTAFPMSKECVRYDGEGHGTQCGVLPGYKWELGTPYTFNVSLVATNESGAHFAGFIRNGRSGEIYKLGEIFTKPAPDKNYNCSRLTVASSPFQEVYTGGNFQNAVSVEGPVFRGVEGHSGDVTPIAGTNCYYHHSCFGKDGPANCRNESSSFCSSPNCSIATTTFVSGRTPVPQEYIPPWDKHPDIGPAAKCSVATETGLSGGLVPKIWGMVVMNVIWPEKLWPEYCCGYCLADLDCVAAQLYGDQCTLHHNSSQYGPITPTPSKLMTTVTPNTRGSKILVV